MNRYFRRTAAVAVVLTFAAAGCSQEHSGVTTGVPSPPAAGTPPAVADPSPRPGAGPTTVDRSFADEDPQPVHVEANGHGYDLVPVVDANGRITSTRFLEDGALMLELEGSLANIADAASAIVTYYDHGSYLFNDVLLLQTPAASGAPALPEAAAAGVGARDSSGVVRGRPQRQMALPCMTELAAFGAASAYFSWALMTYKYNRSDANWSQLKEAAVALIAAGARLGTCLASVWG